MGSPSYHIRISMLTEKIFEKDSYVREFDARVLRCEPRGKEYALILDRTAFFCEGGGQYGDGGTVTDGNTTVTVRETVPLEGEIVHLCDGPLPEGAAVHGVLDFETRYRNMQNHSGEHIVSGLIHTLYGLENVGFHLGRDYVSVDVNGVLDDEALERVEALANDVIYRNVPIRVLFPREEALPTLAYRSKKELTGEVRIVEVEGVDLCACCAPHVARTGEIGMIKILDPMHYKGGLRFYLQCGVSALRDYREKNGRLTEISRLLSAKPENTPAAVAALKNEVGAARQELAALRRAIAEEKLAALTDTEEPLLFFLSTLDTPSLRHLVNGALPHTTSLVAAFLGCEEDGYAFLMASETVPLRPVASRLREELGAKCGGSDRMIQGNVSATSAALTAWIHQLVTTGRKEAP